MCGIALLVDWTGDGVAPSRLSRMTQALARRGPDDEAFLVGDWDTGDVSLRGGAGTDPSAPLPPLLDGGSRRWSIGIGVRRLAVRDPGAAARMPMTDGRGLWLAYNGELYGIDDLRSRLRADGHLFATTGDAEVLLAAWRAWGPDCLSQLSGMWAFVVWDTVRREAWCVRDAIGIKPLYVARTPGGLAVASTIRAIAAALGARPGPDAGAVAEYVATGLIDHGTTTCFDGIHRVAAGSLLELRDGRVTERRWISHAAEDGPARDDDRLDRFHDALDRAIATHLESDRPLGATLSGGLDSGTIALGAASLAPAPALRLFTAGFADADLDERDAARLVAARTPFPLHVTDVGMPVGRTLAADVSTFLDGLDEPVVSSSMYAQWTVMRSVAAHGVTVVVDGQGADELLCGYPALVGPALADEAFENGPAHAWASVAARAGRLQASRAGLAARGAIALLPDRVSIAAGRLTKSTRALSRELAATWDTAPPADADAFAPLPPGRLPAARARLLAVHLPQLLRYLDENAMAWSVEARVPFLDRAVVAAGLGLGGRDLWRDGFQKWVLRDPRRSRLPDAIRLTARKRAFEAPEASWWRGPLNGWLRDVLAPRTIAAQGLLAPAAIAGALAALDRDGTVTPGLWRWANVTWWMAAR
jgi:asparagine synthase (glutamine-hydrolysing)